MQEIMVGKSQKSMSLQTAKVPCSPNASVGEHGLSIVSMFATRVLDVYSRDSSVREVHRGA